MNDVSIGTVRTTPVSVLAAKCADRIADVIGKAAVTLDPEGRVSIEDPDAAAEADIVGVYRCDAGVITLSRAIADDLFHEKMARGFVVKLKRSHVMSDKALRQRKQAGSA